MGKEIDNKEVNKVILIALIISIWAGFSFLAKYKKNWFGNEQEVYPGLLLPGFAGIRPFEGHVAYPEYKVVVYYEDGGEKTHTAPELFPLHPYSRFRSIIYGQKGVDIDKLMIDERQDISAVCFYLSLIELKRESLHRGRVLKENRRCFEFNKGQ